MAVPLDLLSAKVRDHFFPQCVSLKAKIDVQLVLKCYLRWLRGATAQDTLKVFMNVESPALVATLCDLCLEAVRLRGILLLVVTTYYNVPSPMDAKQGPKTTPGRNIWPTGRGAAKRKVRAEKKRPADDIEYQRTEGISKLLAREERQPTHPEGK